MMRRRSIDGIDPVLTDVSRLDADDIWARAASYWNPAPLEAAAVFLPRSTEEVARILKACHKASRPVVVQGGRTGCADGQASGPEDIVLSLEKMDAIIEIDPVDQLAVVEAGVILETLQKAVADAGLFLPLDLGARGSCTIGGNIATNAGGVNVIRYGMMRSLVLGLEAVLPDGRVVSSMKRMLKDNSGYDLKQLFIGTEGTLGVVTRAVLRLQPANAARRTAMAALADFESVIGLLRLARERLGPRLVSYEVMWGDYLRAVSRGHGVRAPPGDGHAFYVIVEIEELREDAAAVFDDTLLAALDRRLIADGVLAASEAERREIWRIRDDFEPILREKPVYLFDVSLPITCMERYVEEVRARLHSVDGTAALHVFGHVGDGNLHLFIQTKASDIARSAYESSVYEPLRRFNGSISAEHGVGREKKAWLGHSRSEVEIELMKILKRTLDPKGILNPGVVFDAECVV
jgi:FAD/FMN-containing dehydrogenase